MKKTKKIFSVFLVLLTIVTTLPLNGFVKLKAEATKEQATEHFNEDRFLAELWSNRIGEFSAAEELISTLCAEISPSGVIVEEVKNNPNLASSLYKWIETLSDPSSLLGKAYTQENYCEMVILDAVNVSLGGISASGIYDSKALAYSKQLTESFSQILGSYTKLTELNLKNKKDLNKFLDMLEEIDYADINEISDFAINAVGYISDTAELVDKLAQFIVLSEIDADLKYCLNYIYEICPYNTPMKNALTTITLCMEDFMGGMIAATYKTFETVSSWSFSLVIGKGLEAATKAHPILASIFAGLKLGTLCCNFLFATDDVNEQLYIMERVYEFENLVKKCMNDLKAKYKKSPTETNAAHYRASVDLLFNVMANVDCDATIKFYDNLYNKGFVDYLRNCFGKYDGASGVKATLTSIKNTRNRALETLSKPDGHTFTMTITKATLNKDGKKVVECSNCNYKMTETISAIKSISLSKTKYVYDGKNKTPKVTVKDANNKVLTKNIDYNLTVASRRNSIGRYTVKVTFMGKYHGTEKVYFYIKTDEPTTIKATSQTTSSIKLSWSAVPGAAGYTVYRYSPSKKAYVKAGTTEGTSLTISKLYAGTKYTFKVVTYGKTKAGKVYESESYAILKTATSPGTTSKISVSKTSNSYVNIKWNSVKGATGYRVYLWNNQTQKWNIAVGSTSNLYATVKNLVPGRSYIIAVKAYIKTDSGIVWGKNYTKLTVKTPGFNEKYARKLLGEASQAYIKWGLDIYSIADTNDCIYLNTKYGYWPYYAVNTGEKTIKEIENHLTPYFDKALTKKIIENSGYVEYNGKLYVARVDGLGDAYFHYTDNLVKISSTHYRYNLKALEFYDNSFVFNVTYDIIYDSGRWIFTEKYEKEHNDLITGFRFISNPEDIK